MTETTTEETAAPRELDPIFNELPDNVKQAIALLPEKLNKNEERGVHLSPRMGRLMRAFRAVNGGKSQKEIAEKLFADAGRMTTHCQVATLEQGGCKKGANVDTIKLLAHGLQVEESVVEAINRADLEARAAAGDELAKKILDPNAGKDQEQEAEAEAAKSEEGKQVVEPEPEAAKPEAPKGKGRKSAPAPQPEETAETVSM